VVASRLRQDAEIAQDPADTKLVVDLAETIERGLE
jgi:hypothetical protein